ncbi:hypothetical protein SAMN04490191_5639 [Pseudomonas lini]|uniref:Uncharacterized protein n=1 Tax=Pseudomonas lini TaxID=163011 RepID=A0A1H2BWH0_9PSED|nr:hypothetical protein SAMN04490191_5639 [Pseudomonas lini]
MQGSVFVNIWRATRLLPKLCRMQDTRWRMQAH